MASQNRIWTLNDVSNHQSVPEAASVGGGKNPPRTSSQHDEGTAPPLEDPLASKFCQPVAKPKDNVPLHHISNLLSEHVCRDTLQRIHNEFFLIVQRRGYNVLTISEFCCCGDGLDQLPRRRRKLKKQHNNVLGYNSTRFGKTKSHTIHLRLRDARNHNQLLPWEDIAGTMAHELSHCVHQNHGPGFYKLMEEILEEHATLLVNGMGLNPDYKPSTSGTTSGTTNMTTARGGQTLGGSKTGKSRLLGETGRRLGGGKTAPSSLRNAMAQAAEARQRQLHQARRLMECSREPCVIEIFDSDDEEDEVTMKRPGKATGIATTKKPKVYCIDLTATTTKSGEAQVASSNKKNPTKKRSSCIDLTSDDDEPAVEVQRNTSEQDGWSCARCTLQNKPLALVCDACLLERNKM